MSSKNNKSKTHSLQSTAQHTDNTRNVWKARGCAPNFSVAQGAIELLMHRFDQEVTRRRIEHFRVPYTANDGNWLMASSLAIQFITGDGKLDDCYICDDFEGDVEP